MPKTIDNLRNENLVAMGRFKREASATFTKEDLAAICDAVDYEIDTDLLPPKSQMRAGILAAIGERDDDATDSVDRAFRKDDPEAIASPLFE